MKHADLVLQDPEPACQLTHWPNTQSRKGHIGIGTQQRGEIGGVQVWVTTTVATALFNGIVELECTEMPIVGGDECTNLPSVRVRIDVFVDVGENGGRERGPWNGDGAWDVVTVLPVERGDGDGAVALGLGNRDRNSIAMVADRSTVASFEWVVVLEAERRTFLLAAQDGGILSKFVSVLV